MKLANDLYVDPEARKLANDLYVGSKARTIVIDLYVDPKARKLANTNNLYLTKSKVLLNKH
jgi:hypothetical protein